MPGSVPDSYRRLASYSLRLSAGTRLYEQGAVPDRFYLVLKGEVIFEVVAEAGESEDVARAYPGALVGHVAAFTGRPTSAAARVDREAVVLAIPLARVLDAFREAPELALQLVRLFAGGKPSVDVEDAGAEAGAEEPRSPEDPGDEGDGQPAAERAIISIPGVLDEMLFFADTVTCPVSMTQFEFPRVRTRAVRPGEDRASDFHVRYQGIDPTRYGVVVCPVCAYAAYFDDFAKLDDLARPRLWEDREARLALMPRPLNGIRSDVDAVLALELAMRCYELRGTNDSRRAILQHRRAWLAREAGKVEEERTWLIRARESYQQAYEHDTRISEDAAARIAYLVGDLSMRLGETLDAAQWLETAVRIAPGSTGIVRTARDRLQDVRQIIKQERLAS